MATDQPPPPSVVVDAAAKTPPRRRPLRTYGRRSTHTSEDSRETTHIGAKRKEREPATPDSGRGDSPRRPRLPSPDQPQAQPPNRGSILAYFKPVPSNSSSGSTSLSDVASSDAAESLSTPPTSPTPLLRSRKRRRLTTRPQFGGLDQHTETGASCCAAGSESGEAAETPRACDALEDGANITTSGKVHGAQRTALNEVEVNTLHHQPESATGSAAGATTAKKRPGKRPAKDMTQTTLSLAIQKEPCFTVCGVCDILYNPLNEKDRREHSRRHAAHSRIKRKTAS